jgi:hypothetical protein
MVAVVRTADALAYFGSRSKLAEAAGVERSTTRSWGALVPPRVATKLEIRSGGILKLDLDAYIAAYIVRIYGPQ